MGLTTTFRIATAVALLHAVDDAFLNRQPGVPLDQHVLAALVALGAGVAAIVAFPRLRPGVRAPIALVFGVFALVNGILHVRHIAGVGPAGSDYTGAAAAAAGAILVLLALAVLFRHRGEGRTAATRRRRWAIRVAVALAVIPFVIAFLFPASAAIVVTHKYREPIGEPPSRAYRSVTFAASDGLKLSGWYVPSRNGAAVILVHGGGGDRTGAEDHAALLRRHGYGVLLYDSRGRGSSEGSPNALGWGWEKDVAGALEFLRSRADVDDERIGGIGLSTGADVLIEVAANDHRIAAVVSDGATARSFDDYRNLAGLDADAPYFWTMINAVRVLSGSSPGPPLTELVARMSPTPLFLISAGNDLNERGFNRVYAAAAREPFDHWHLPDVRHTAAVRERAAEYERRVVGFFDEHLLGR